MSDALNRSVAPFCHSQDRLGGVAVAIFDRSAGSADEDAVIQQHAFLGSRTACVARHRRVGGLFPACFYYTTIRNIMLKLLIVTTTTGTLALTSPWLKPGVSQAVSDEKTGTYTYKISGNHTNSDHVSSGKNATNSQQICYYPGGSAAFK